MLWQALSSASSPPSVKKLVQVTPVENPPDDFDAESLDSLGGLGPNSKCDELLSGCVVSDCVQPVGCFVDGPSAPHREELIPVGEPVAPRVWRARPACTGFDDEGSSHSERENLDLLAETHVNQNYYKNSGSNQGRNSGAYGADIDYVNSEEYWSGDGSHHGWNAWPPWTWHAQDWNLAKKKGLSWTPKATIGNIMHIKKSSSKARGSRDRGRRSRIRV